MRRILKFNIPDPMVNGGKKITVMMPVDARILWCDVQNGEICLWALCEAGVPREYREFTIFGTGNEIEDIYFLDYIGTIQLPPFVWHIFEKKPIIPNAG